VAFAALAFVACKEPGTVELVSDFPDGCTPATHAQVYLVPGGSCACECGDCLSACQGSNCKLGCGSELCSIEELDRGIKLEPDEPGVYAVVFQLLRVREDGLPELVASACGDPVLDRDGTDSSTLSVSGQCCP